MLRSLYDGRGIKQAVSGLNDVDSAGKDAASGLGGATGGLVSLSGIATKLVAAGTLVAVAKGLREIWEAGREGAQADLSAQAFEIMTGGAIEARETLEELRTTARGTASDLEFMRGVTTALGGTSGELRDKLLENSGALLEMSRSASLLNPQLGDTAFLYESIIKGIRRGSPLLIDNLGIIVKIGEANEAYAAQIGKTVEQMTAEERSMALLNATLEAGISLNEVAAQIDTERADAIATLAAKWQNLKDTLAGAVVPAVADTATAVGLLVDELQEAADVFDFITGGEAGVNAELAETQRRLLLASSSWEDYAKSMVRTRVAQGTIASLIGSQTIGLIELKDRTVEQQEEVEKWTRGILGVTEATYEQNVALLEHKDALEKAAEAEVEVITKSEILYDKKTELSAIMRQSTADFAEQNAILGAHANRLDENNAKMREMGEAAREAAAAVRDNFNDMWSAIDTNLASTISNALKNLEFLELGGANLQSAYDEIFLALADNKITPEQAAEAFNSLFVEATELQVLMGDITPYEAAKQIAEELGISVGEAKEKMDGIVDAANIIDQLRGTIQINVTVSGSQLALAIAGYLFMGSGGSLGMVEEGFENFGTGAEGTTGAGAAGSGATKGTGATKYASGGSFVIPPGYENHSWPVGPNRWAESGEEVTITPKGASQNVDRRRPEKQASPTIIVMIDGKEVAYRMDERQGRKFRKKLSSGGGLTGG